MKKRIFLFLIIATILVLSSMGNTVLAKENLPVSEIKDILTEVAIKNQIPPEILKAIAMEESQMRQFNSNGEPVYNVDGDGGIGIMQVTLEGSEIASGKYDMERLANDTRYNIEIGALKLLEKWNYSFIPRINDHNRKVLEHWYFAIMAYNGLSKVNDPTYRTPTYQDKIYSRIETSSLVGTNPIKKFAVSYPQNNYLMFFEQENRHYHLDDANMESTQMFKVSDQVYTFNTQLDFSNFRENIGGEVIARLPHYTPLQIVSGPYHDENRSNHFAFYKVRGKGIEGYIATSNLREGKVTAFKDIKAGTEEAGAVAFLELRNVVSGYSDGTFRPNEPLLRRHAAGILVRELGLTLPEGYESKAKDMKQSDLGYMDMIIAEAHGLMGAGGQLRPNEYLSRAQMAVILNRAFKNELLPAEKKHEFKDVPGNYWSYNEINVLLNNNITVVQSFRPADPTTRVHFALFLKRILG